MARACEICGKTAMVGNTIIRHGMPKKKGGIGLHTTGITRRRFEPNLQKIRVRHGGGVTRKLVCATCIKAGKIEKA